MISMRLSEAAVHAGGSLRGQDAVLRGCSIDSRAVEAGNLFIALRGDRFDGHDFLEPAKTGGAIGALVATTYGGTEEGLPLIRVADTRRAMGRLAARWRDGFDIPLVAVTGSNGKTTVKEMIASILGLQAVVLSTRGNLNNDIGVPLTLFGLGGEHRYAVIEMGANHPGEIAWLTELARPQVAVITQCAPAHLEGFGSVEGVARAKAEIYTGLAGTGTAVINMDDDYARYWRQTAGARQQLGFGIRSRADFHAAEVSFDPATGGTSFLLHAPAGETRVRLALTGEHNVMNALAAAACCTAVGISLEDIRTGLQKMPGVKGRMQLLSAPGGLRVFDDTYNANPASLEAGLKVLASYPGEKCLILGDMGELGENAAALHHEAGSRASELGVDRLYALGDLVRHAVAGFGDGGRHFEDAGALMEAASSLPAGTTVLVKGSRLMAMERVVKALMEGD